MKINRREFARNAALVGGAVAAVHLGGASNTFAQAGDEIRSGEEEVLDRLRQQFRTPPKKYRPLVRWWWPGDDVTAEELRREVAVLDEAGFGGAEIQAFFKGLDRNKISSAQLSRINGYATNDYFQHVRIVAEEARRRDMFIDYTFGSGWPFGGGEEITPELAAIELRSSHLSVAGPAQFRGRLQLPSLTDGDPKHGVDVFAGLSPEWAERLRRRTRIVAVVAVRGEDAEWHFEQPGRGRNVAKSGRLEDRTAVNLTSKMRADGYLQWDVPAGTWQLFVFCALPTGQRVNGGAGEGPQLVMDHLSADAFRAHANRVGDIAIPVLRDVLGNGLRAIFCDSLEVRANLFWSDDFLAEFQKRNGYDLLPYLPILQAQSFAEPYAEFLDTPVFDIEGKGAQVRRDYRNTVAELMKERFYDEFNRWAHKHGLLARTQAHGAPVDVLRIYEDADIPETEHLYDMGAYDFLKLASSAAHINGRPIVGCESFVWPNTLYQTTPEEMKRTVDELVTAGVNAVVYHGFAYRIPDLPAPGWHPFSGINDSGNYSSQFNEFNPLWPYFAKLNGYITRLQFLSQIGKNVAAVALLRDDFLHGAEELPPTPKLNQALLDAGYNYDHINANSISQSFVRNGMLVTAGGAEYRTLIVPKPASLSPELTRKLQSFTVAGLFLLVVGVAPDQATGLLHNAHIVDDVESCISSLRGSVEPNLRFLSEPIFFIQKRIGRRDAFFIRNDSDTVRHIDAEFDADGQPELWDAWTGETESLFAVREASRARIQLELKPFASALVVFTGKAASRMVARPVPESLRQATPVGDSGWKFSATGMNQSGEQVTITRDMSLLVDWSLDEQLRGFSGRATYTTVFTAPLLNSSQRLILDLGRVKEVAEIKVNGKPAATLLMRPYEVDITARIRVGENRLEVSVTNTLFNCMVLREPRTFRPGPTENSSGLLSGGLIGPVQLKSVG